MISDMNMISDFEKLKDAYVSEAKTSGLSGLAAGAQSNLSINGCATTWPNPNYNYTYPVYIDRTQKAFAIAKWLIDKKLVTVKDVPAFITLIDGLIQHV